MTPTEWPTFTEEQLRFLEATFPPRCKDPLESLEAHMLYAGHVALIALMRNASGIKISDEDEELEQALLHPDN